MIVGIKSASTWIKYAYVHKYRTRISCTAILPDREYRRIRRLSSAVKERAMRGSGFATHLSIYS